MYAKYRLKTLFPTGWGYEDFAHPVHQNVGGVFTQISTVSQS